MNTCKRKIIECIHKLLRRPIEREMLLMEKRGWETNGDGRGRAWAYRAQAGGGVVISRKRVCSYHIGDIGRVPT